MNNQEHVALQQSNISCGILEAYRFGEDSYKALYRIGAYFFHPSQNHAAAHLIFSGLKDGNASKFADELYKHFGKEKIYVTKGVENPNTGNIIYMWIWEIQHNEFKAWYCKERAERVKSCV